MAPNLRRNDGIPGLRSRWIGYAAVLACVSSFAMADVGMEYVLVGDPGNDPDSTGFGSVASEYRLGTHEVTNAQYATFLNAVAATDSSELYNEAMEIARTGSPGSYSYSTTRGAYPVRFVSFYDAARFANWLHNGQPTGDQGASTTEDGAYTFSGPTSVGPRNPGARVYLPSEDEWYKAAYFRVADGSGYWRFPTRSDMEPVPSVPSGAANSANYEQVAGGVTEVGSYAGSVGPYGTADQAGNVWEWTEGVVGDGRSVRGGSWDDYALLLDASYRDSDDPEAEYEFIGFRVAALPLGPGTAFQRGNVNQDSSVDLSDAVTIFGYLFMGDSPPVCVSAADANDDSDVDVSDGIALLNFLFLGARAPPVPFAACGVDPTPDDLACEEFRPCVTP